MREGDGDCDPNHYPYLHSVPYQLRQLHLSALVFQAFPGSVNSQQFEVESLFLKENSITCVIGEIGEVRFALHRSFARAMA